MRSSRAQPAILGSQQVPSSETRPDPAATPRLLVCLLIGSGVIAAAQIGKAIISLPMIRADLALGLDLAGLIVATFATLGAVIGIGAGAVVGRFGLRRSLVGGMTLIAVGNVVGAAAPNELALLLARIIEGIGFFGAVLAIPTMLTRIVSREMRDCVMAAWSAYMPTGIMLMLLLGPLVAMIGWRTFWLADALFVAACALLLAVALPRQPETRPAGQLFAGISAVLRNVNCVALAVAFFAYSCQIFSLAFALPLLLTTSHGVSLGMAGLLSAMVLAVSAAGHIVSGLLLRAGVPIWASIAAAFGFFTVSGFAIFGTILPSAGVAMVAALALGIGGLAPGAIYAAAPHAAPSREAVPLTIGLFQQASNLGQFAGPVMLGLGVQHFGWTAAPAILTPLALVGFVLAIMLRGSLHGALAEAAAPAPAVVPIRVR
jgi:MFS transporter, DHA1 family, inner membrane transport protein